jgi:hypothetical protein
MFLLLILNKNKTFLKINSKDFLNTPSALNNQVNNSSNTNSIYSAASPPTYSSIKKHLYTDDLLPAYNSIQNQV